MATMPLGALKNTDAYQALSDEKQRRIEELYQAGIQWPGQAGPESGGELVHWVDGIERPKQAVLNPGLAPHRPMPAAPEYKTRVALNSLSKQLENAAASGDCARAIALANDIAARAVRAKMPDYLADCSRTLCEAGLTAVHRYLDAGRPADLETIKQALRTAKDLAAKNRQLEPDLYADRRPSDYISPLGWPIGNLESAIRALPAAEGFMQAVRQGDRKATLERYQELHELSRRGNAPDARTFYFPYNLQRLYDLIQPTPDFPSPEDEYRRFREEEEFILNQQKN